MVNNNGVPDVVFKFTVADADGNPHEYQSVYLDCEAGERLLYEMVGMMGGTVGALVGSVLEHGGSLAEAMQSGDAIDLKAAGQEISTAVIRNDMPKFTRNVLANTSRDGDGLKLPHVWNAAYQRNQYEIFKAVWEVLRGNRLFPL